MFSLITSSQFQKDHYGRSENNPLLLTIDANTTDDPYNLDLTTYNINEKTFVDSFSIKVSYPCYGNVPVQSLLGLVFMETTCIKPTNNHLSESNSFIYNPFTNELVSLPPGDGISWIFGFGYAASAKEFKVVRFFIAEPYEDKCAVFTLGTHDWREASSPPHHLCFGKATFLRGALHLLPFNSDNINAIIAFDLETEEDKLIPLPKYGYTILNYQLEDRLMLTELGGSLCMSINRRTEGRLELWLLKDYDNKEWLKWHTIENILLFDFDLVFGLPISDSE